MRALLIAFLIVLTLSGVIVSVYFFVELQRDYTVVSDSSIDLTKSGEVGDFIGGVIGTIFSFTGIILLVLTLNEQSKTSFKDRFESNFFELLKLHRQNVDEIIIEKKVFVSHGKSETKTFEKRKAFAQIMDDFVICRTEVKPFFRKKREDDIYEENYAKQLKDKFKITNSNLNLTYLAKINIPYCIVFYGVDSEGIMILKRLFKGKYKEKFTEDLLNYVRLKPVEESYYWNKWSSISEIKNYKTRIQVAKLIQLRRNDLSSNINVEVDTLTDMYFYKNNFVKYYGGHQFRLGHYFRHLFQSFKYVNTQSKLSEDEKYFYAKTLRAQLSTYEQALLFVNSLSFLGLVWDLTPEVNLYQIDPFRIKRVKRQRLISKFNLIKNLPGEHFFGIKYKEFYPDIKYEFDK